MLIILSLAIAARVQAQDASAILETVREKEAARWASVENYAVEHTVQGVKSPVYYEKVVVDGQPVFRLVPPTEWARRDSGVTTDTAEPMAAGLDMIGPILEKEHAGPLGAYMGSMTRDMAAFLRAAEEYEENDGRADAAAGVRGGREFARRARFAGRESVEGREALLIRAEDLSDIQLPPSGGQGKFLLDVASLWIDAGEYVPLRFRMEGRMEADGKTVPVTLELLELDHKQVGPLYEPQRRVMRISGLMEAMASDAKKKQELEKMRREAERARSEMANMEDKLAKLTPAQRQMVEGQMRRAMAQLDMMTRDGIAEVEIRLMVISVNKGPPLDWKPSA